MKKLMLMCMALFVSAMMYGQAAYEKAKIFDNTFVGAGVGVTTPLNFNSVFPVNSVANIKVGKEITPIFGFEIEGQAFFNDNNVGRWTQTFVKGTNVGLNGVINLSNLIFDYKGSPRKFELSTNTGLGWLHYWNTSGNALTAKTALDIAYNFNDVHSIVITPGVWWNINDAGSVKTQFNKNLAQLGIFAGYVYHFKTSNGTHTFKTYDITALNNEINSLRTELVKKPQQIVKEIVNTKIINPTIYVFFAKDSYTLTPTAKLALDNIKGTVDIVATASPEGTQKHNQELSEKRANTVAEYLRNKGVQIQSVVGKGVDGDSSNRVAIITLR